MGAQDPRLQQTRAPVAMAPAATTPAALPPGLLNQDASTAQVYGAMGAPPAWENAMLSRFGLGPQTAAPMVGAPTFYTPPAIMPPAMAPAAPITSPSVSSPGGFGNLQKPTTLGEYFRANQQGIAGMSPQEQWDAYEKYQLGAVMQQQKIADYLSSMGYQQTGEPAPQPFGGIRYFTG